MAHSLLTLGGVLDSIDTMPKKIVVTGATGQDGSYMIEYLLANTQDTIIAAIRRTSQAILSNLKGVLDNPRVKLVTMDLTDPHSIDSVVREEQPDYFINFGAQAFVGASWQIPALTNDTNADGVYRCLEAIRRHAPHCRFYNAGTSEEFGKVEYSPQDEKHPARPQSPYGASKVAARQHVRVYRESYGLYAVQGWLFNHESERRGADYVTRKITLGVARIARAIKDGKPFDPIELGNIDAKRDWSHAYDFVDGVWRMLNQDEIKFSDGTRRLTETYSGNHAEYIKEYVLSSGETHTVREFIELAFAAAGITNGKWYNPSGNPTDERYELHYLGVLNRKKWEDDSLHRWTHTHTSDMDWARTVVRINPVFYRPAEVELLLGDSSAARSELGWQPKVSFTELVSRMVKSDLAAVGLS